MASPGTGSAPLRERLALVVLGQLARIPPLAPRLWHRLGRLHASRGRQEAAIAFYEQGLARRKPPYASLHHDLGIAQLETGRFLEAECSFGRAIARNPRASWSHQGLGEALMAQGLAGGAERAFRAGLALRPHNPWLHFHLIRSIAFQDRLEEALDGLICAANLMATDQGVPPIPFAIDLIDKSLATPQRVRGLLDGVARYPETSEVLVSLSIVLSHLGEYPEAARLLRRHEDARSRKDTPGCIDPGTDPAREKPPSFLIIGMAKAGTTALYRYLIQHPGIAPALTKEVQYWSRFHEAGEEWYRAHFPPLADGSRLMTTEASPHYFIHPDAPVRIARERPDIRLILLLRDPVARAYSAYQAQRMLGRERRSWEAIVADEIEALPVCPLDEAELDAVRHRENRPSYLLGSAALPYLKRWRRWFPPEQMLIAQNSAMKRDTPGTVARVCEFLGLPRFQLSCAVPFNQGSYVPMAPEVKWRLEAWFAPHQAALEQFLADRPEGGGP